jgi:large subunit ribosomal protein L13
MQLERITTHTKPIDREPSWLVIDANGERLGRVASRIANVLQGKNKADYSRHQISGDFVIVVNASKIDISGNKRTQKIYYRHTGYVGHLRQRSFDEMLERFPARVIEMAVKGMLPRNRLGRQMFRRLKVYGGAEHPHEAQVNAGQGKPKQAPAATATRTRRKAASTAEEPVAEVQAVAAAAEAESAEAAAEEAAVEAVEETAVEPGQVEEDSVPEADEEEKA